MKKLMVVFLLAMFSIASMPTVVVADAKQGQRIFKKKFRKKCRFSGVKFARHHTKVEWEEIWEEGRFKEETLKICPRLNIDTIKEEWWKEVYDFSYKYASDGVVPKC
ncbi:MAG: hypothetical protein ABXS92_07935 [Sulfurimonas sp.]